MYSADMAFGRRTKQVATLPEIPELRALYNLGVRFSTGELTMIGGRPSGGKTALMLYMLLRWHEAAFAAGKPMRSLYFAGDSTERAMSYRVAGAIFKHTVNEIERNIYEPVGGEEWRERYAAGSRGLGIDFVYGRITGRQIEAATAAHYEVHGAQPDIIVIDNLMDVEDGHSEYSAQMETMQAMSDMSKDINANVFVLHHASDKTAQAKFDPTSAPARSEIKNGMTEKPDLVLTVALSQEAGLMNIGVVKNRQGPSDQSGKLFATVRSRMEYASIEAYNPLALV